MLAATNEHLDTVEVLLEAGASMDVFSNSGHARELVIRLYICLISNQSLTSILLTEL